MKYAVKLVEAFWKRTRPSGDCVLWTGAQNGVGYGVVSVERRNVLAHRFAYELENGDIPAGQDLDHLCRVRACVNPDHLEAVTRGENLRRSELTRPGMNARKTHCPKGHAFDSTYTDKAGRTHRHCLRCRRAAASRQR